MKTSDFMYDLPEEQIAQTPIEPRDHSRLMVVTRTGAKPVHRHFYDVIDYLRQIAQVNERVTVLFRLHRRAHLVPAQVRVRNHAQPHAAPHMSSSRALIARARWETAFFSSIVASAKVLSKSADRNSGS